MRSRGLWSEPEEITRPLIPSDEAERLIELALSGAAVDPTPEERFDKITRMAQRVFNVPFAAISFVEGERQWYKSKQGLVIAELTRDQSFWGHAINDDAVYVIEDTVLDPLFAANALVVNEPHIRFYAAQPVKGVGGHMVGTICIMDKAPRAFTHDDQESLRDLGEMVQKELQLKPSFQQKAPPD